MKDHDGAPVVGIGSSKVVTVAIDLKTGMGKAFASAKSSSIFPGEIEVNKILYAFLDYFVPSDIIYYLGPHTDREIKVLERRPLKTSKEENVPKIGMLMELGEMCLDRFLTKRKASLTFDQRIKMCSGLAVIIKVLHELGIVHYDIKTVNLMLSENGCIKLLDFGFATIIGAVQRGMGTSGFIPPERIQAGKNNVSHLSDTPADVWTMAATMFNILGVAWENLTGQLEEDYDLLLDKNRLEDMKISAFKKVLASNKHPYLNDLFDLFDILKICLQLDPKKRPPASWVSIEIDKIIKRSYFNIDKILSGNDLKRLPIVAHTITGDALLYLKIYGVTEDQLVYISNYYETFKTYLKIKSESTNTHIRRGGFNELSRSLVHVVGPKEEMYVLLKTHADAPEVSLDVSKRGTLAVNIKTGEVKIFDSFLANEIGPRELKANKKTSKFPRHFVTEDIVFYEGPFRSRHRTANSDLSTIPKINKVEKVGIIKDYRKSLLDIILDQKKPMTFDEKISCCWNIAHVVNVLHKQCGYIHGNLKLANFLSYEVSLKLSDFSFAQKIGDVQKYTCLKEYRSPEVTSSTYTNVPYLSNPASDVWNLSVIMLKIFGDRAWHEEFKQNKKSDLTDFTYISNLKKRVFIQILDKNPSSVYVYDVIRILGAMLQISTEKRKSAQWVEDELYKIIWYNDAEIELREQIFNYGLYPKDFNPMSSNVLFSSKI